MGLSYAMDRMGDRMARIALPPRLTPIMDLPEENFREQSRSKEFSDSLELQDIARLNMFLWMCSEKGTKEEGTPKSVMRMLVNCSASTTKTHANNLGVAMSCDFLGW